MTPNKNSALMTAEETLKKHCVIFNEPNPDTCFIDAHPKAIVSAMKEYAKSVAEQVRRDCAENAEILLADGEFYEVIGVDKQSILNVDITKYLI
jgi:hypothetical protein